MMGILLITAVSLVLAGLFWLVGPPLLGVMMALAALSVLRHLLVMRSRAGLHLGDEGGPVQVTIINDQIMAMSWTFLLALGLYLMGLMASDWAGHAQALADWLGRNAGLTAWVDCCNLATPARVLPGIDAENGALWRHMAAAAQVSAMIWGVAMLVLAIAAKRMAPWLTFSLPMSTMGGRTRTGWAAFMRLAVGMIVVMGLWKLVGGESGLGGNPDQPASGILRLIDPRVNPALYLMWQLISSILLIMCFSLLAGLLVSDSFPGLGRLIAGQAKPADPHAGLAPPREMGAAISGPKRRQLEQRQERHDRLISAAKPSPDNPE